MDSRQFISEISDQLQYLFAFARQANELDFVGGLSPEFRGMQDEGWSTVQTAMEVSEEFRSLIAKPLNRAALRSAYALYVQLAEAGGFYEVLRNQLRIIEGEIYVLWPFRHLVKVRKSTRRVIGPNSNAVFRDLANTAEKIGMVKLATLLELAFDDQLRNGFAHADYIIWKSELRLRNRNGGHVRVIPFTELSDIFSRGAMFFELLNETVSSFVRSYNPPKVIIGKFSANFPMPWTVAFDPNTGSFSISGSAPGPQSSAEYERQVRINALRAGRVFVLFSFGTAEEEVLTKLKELENKGFEVSIVEIESNADQQKFLQDCNHHCLWRLNHGPDVASRAYIASPFGVSSFTKRADVEELLPNIAPIKVVDAQDSSSPTPP